MIVIANARLLEPILEFVYNPVSELCLALDLLCHPEHHPLHQKWAGDVLDRLTHKERMILAQIEGILGGYLNLDAYLDFDGYPFTEEDPQKDCLAFLKDRTRWKSPSGRYDPEMLIPFLAYLWQYYISPLVEEHRTCIIDQIRRGRGIVQEQGLAALFPQISERAGITGKGELKIEKWVESRFDASCLQSFHIQCSLFAFPHLVMADRHETGFFTLCWELPFRGDEVVAPGIDRISAKAFALSDKSRLRLLLMLAEQPMSQKELTRQMGFAKSTISRHINILIEAGIITTSEAERNTTLYVNRDPLKEFSRELMEWLK